MVAEPRSRRTRPRPLLLPAAAGLMLLAWLVPPAGWAHGLGLFATADGRVITGTVQFAGGAPAAGVAVRVEDPVGRLLTTLETDAEGRFRYRAEMPVSHRLIAGSPDGHRATWRLDAAELAPGFAAAAADPPDAAMTAEAGIAIDPALEAAIERAVARQLAPLRRELAAAQSRAGLRDVLGGLGWIAGITGLALWWRVRRAGAG